MTQKPESGYLIEMDNTTTDGVYLDRVRLLHAPQPQKVTSLRADMEETGWEGRPVILAQREDGICALSGTHRLSAVSGLPIAVPVVWLPDGVTEEQWARLDSTVFDYERMRVLRELASEHDEEEAWAATLHIMWLEERGES